jgi:hypothetical protein
MYTQKETVRTSRRIKQPRSKQPARKVTPLIRESETDYLTTGCAHLECGETAGDTVFLLSAKTIVPYQTYVSPHGTATPALKTNSETALFRGFTVERRGVRTGSIDYTGG